jgi:tight adherence protein B
VLIAGCLGCRGLGVSPVAVAAVGAAGVGVALAWRRHGSKRLAGARAAAVVEVTFALAAELRAGHPPAAALEAAAGAGGPLAPRLREAASAARGGASAGDELARLAALPGGHALRAVAAAWEVTEQVGGAVADVLVRLGESLDAEAEAERALAATLAGPRSTMLLLAVLPAFGVMLGESIGAHPLALLLHQPLGWGLSAAALLLDAAGLAWTGWLTRSASRP